MKNSFKFIISGLVIIIIAFLLPRLILGTNSYIAIHDNLDSSFPLISILVKNGLTFSSGKNVDIIMGGIPREFFGSGLNYIFLLKFVFEPFTAYIMNDIFVHFAAFTGLFLLLSSYILRDEDSGFIIFGSSLCFAFLPFYSSYGLSIAGLPLLFYCFFNLRNEKNSVYDYIVIFLFPFFSYLVLTGIFTLLILGLIFVKDIISSRRINKQFFYGLLLLTLTYCIVEYNLIYISFISKNYISHRTSWNPYSPLYVLPFLDCVIDFFKNFALGQFHAASVHTPVLIITILLFFLTRDKKQLKPVFILLTVIIVFSFFYSMQSWYVYAVLKEKFKMLNAFNFGRFHWFHPVLWYILFALCLAEIKKFKYAEITIPLLIIVQLSYVIMIPVEAKQQELKHNVIRLFKEIEYKDRKMSFKEFYSEELFKDIDNFIGQAKSTYRIGCVGFSPAVAQYNGFYTLDSYMNNYPLAYKQKFRKIISKELDRNPVNRMYFDDWGSRCYFFIHNLNKNAVYNIKTSNLQETDVDFDIKIFKEMGGKYFFSTVKIKNSDKIFLKYLKTFEESELPWRIHLYQVDI